ncbi:unnamed protein product [Brachionus calyciflorus]|uniref:Fibrous sheath-interacting protein 1 n=1 Tax=Brachionus calyciflorus TaxID=104777 RepID=A0A813P0Y3_9BILA|nr:unnamed protein product [Brachionus calyciflorus]
MNEGQEDIFDEFRPKYLDVEGRDSIDTLELLKESTEVSLGNQENDDDKFDIDEDETLEEEDDDEDLDYNNEPNSQTNSFVSSSQNDEKQSQPLAIEHKKLNDEYFKNLKDDDDVETSDLDHLEPKLREAWIQMRRLDKKLDLVSKKERQVKRETFALIQKNRAELELLRLNGEHKESKLETENTAHFLALTNVDLDEDFEKDFSSNESETLTPVFKTQIPDLNESDLNDSSRLSMPKKASIENKTNLPSKSDVSSNFTKSSKAKSSLNSKSNIAQNKKSQEKNFIKRNIKLAQDAGGALAMTDEEKQRLNEILLDLDNLENNDKNKNNLGIMNGGDNSTLLVEYNPMSVNLAEGDGFTPNHDELEKLKRINTALEKRNYSRNTSSRVSGMLSQSQFSNFHVIEPESYYPLTSSESKQIKLNDEFDENEFGDKFIREARISREQEVRLKYLDSQLEKIKCLNYESETISTPETRTESVVSVVSEDQLKKLIDEYYNENSQNIIENGNREMLKLETLIEESDHNGEESDVSMPKINDDIIQKLLNEAKNEGLYQIVESTRTISEMESEHSFYEEALESIKEREKFWTQRKNSNLEHQVPETEHTISSFEPENNEQIPLESMRRISSKSSLNSSNQFQNENKSIINTLPPLVNKNDYSDLQRDNSRLSISSLSSTSSTPFPKIDSRYLPK